MAENAIITRVSASPLDIAAADWNALWALQAQPTPFMRHEYLAALHASGSATPRTGWAPCFLSLWQDETLIAACPLYLKSHSYGEYVFDWAWANAHAEHGVPYYPKAVVAVPFTPVPGTRLMARDASARTALVQALRDWCENAGVSSLHILFAADEDLNACAQAGLMQRQTVQFHWKNVAPTLGTGVSSLPLSGEGLTDSRDPGALAASGRPGGGSGAGSANTLGVLDFQDAVYGPITYDIASQLRDAFISWEEEFVIDVTVRYWEKARKAGLLGANSASGWGADFGEFYRAVEWMGLQRHLKVAGIFARLTLRDNKPKYLADAPRFLHYIRSTANRYRQLGPLLQLVDEIEGTTPVTGFAYGRM